MKAISVTKSIQGIVMASLVRLQLFRMSGIFTLLFGATLTANANAHWLTIYERALTSSAHGDAISFDHAVRNFTIVKYCDESSRDTQLQYVWRVR